MVRLCVGVLAFAAILFQHTTEVYCPLLKMQAYRTDLEAGTRLAVWQPRNYFLLESLFDLLADSGKVYCAITSFLLRRDVEPTIHVDLRS